MTRRLVLILTVPLLLLVGADQGVRLVAQASLAGRLQGELDLSERPRVRLSGFPFLLHLARQRFPHASMEAENATLRGFRFARIGLDLRHVRFSFRSGEMSSAGGTGELAVDERAAEEYLAGQGIEAEVAFGAGTVRVGRRSGELAAATGSLELRGRRLVFRPDEMPGAGIGVTPTITLEVRLPKLPGLFFRSVRVEQGRAVVAADLAAGSLPLR